MITLNKVSIEKMACTEDNNFKHSKYWEMCYLLKTAAFNIVNTEKIALYCQDLKKW